MAEPNWDMTPYFPSLGGPEYTRFQDALEEDARALAAELDGTPPRDAAARRAFAASLLRFEDLARRTSHLRSYLGCVSAADAENERAQLDTARLTRHGAELAKLEIAVQTALAELDDAELDRVCAEPELAGTRFWLERHRERARRSMPADLEALAAELGTDGLSAWARLYGQVAGKLCFTLELPGRPPETLPVAQTRSLLEDSDAAVRGAALEGANRAWEGVGHVCAAALNAISGARLTLYARRGIEHFLEPACFDAAITRDTLACMLDTIASRAEIPRRYLRRKARMLGRERMPFCDLLAPLPLEGARRIPYPEAQSQILSAFGRAYPALGEHAQRAFDGHWVDWEPRPAKRPGGFCSGSHLIGQTRVFMTYGGALGDVATLAHELGHSFHGWLARTLRPWLAASPMTLAETASTFAEQLLIDAVLDDPDAELDVRLGALDRRLQDAATFLLNIPMRFAFESRLYEERARGELSVARLCTLMCDAQREVYGDALDPDALDPWFWASKLHFYILQPSFYNFPYSFGYLFSLGICARARREGPDFLPVYERLLRGTGSARAEDLAADVLGVDLTRPAFWNESIDGIAADLERFEELAERRFP